MLKTLSTRIRNPVNHLAPEADGEHGDAAKWMTETKTPPKFYSSGTVRPIKWKVRRNARQEGNCTIRRFAMD
jgi:hypothetical protein